MVAVVQPRPDVTGRPRRALVPPSGRPAPDAVSGSTYRRRRAAAAAVAVGVAVALQGLLGTIGDAARPRPSPPVTGERLPTYVVQPGDTFWSIARRISPDGDPRPVVDRLVAEHASTVLHVGERIALPERR
jgi:nucleoid-associated protein YgaU